MKKDWTGNYNSIFKTLGASYHTKEERQSDDYYATDPKAAECLLKLENFNHTIWECACGEGHLSKVFEQAGYKVYSTDIANRGYGEQLDFLKTIGKFNIDIITNPPYKYAYEFVEHALDIVNDGCKVAMFLKLQFLEGKSLPGIECLQDK